MKAALILILVTVVGASVAWLVNIVQEREQLAVEVALQQDANLTHIASIAKLGKEKDLLESQVIKRIKAAKLSKIKLQRLRKQLNVEITKLSEAEKKCLHSDVPVPILNFLRRENKNSPKD